MNSVVVGIAPHNAFPAPSKVSFCAYLRKTACLDVPVNGRNAQRFFIRKQRMPASGNGFRRPAAAESIKYEIPFLRAGQNGFRQAIPSSPNVKILGAPVIVPILIVRLFARLVLGAVSFHLSAYCRGASFKDSGNFPEAFPFSQKLL